MQILILARLLRLDIPRNPAHKSTDQRATRLPFGIGQPQQIIILLFPKHLHHGLDQSRFADIERLGFLLQLRVVKDGCLPQREVGPVLDEVCQRDEA